MASAVQSRKSGMKKEQPLPKKPTTVEEWVKAKLVAPQKFTMNEDGDLVVPPYKAGESETVIVVRGKTEATTDHIRRFFTMRKEELAGPENEFATAKRTLQETTIAYARGQATVDDVLQANHAVNIAQCKVNALAKFPRNFERLEGLVTNDLNFDWYRRSKIAMPVLTMQTTVFPWEAFWTEASDKIPELEENEDDFESEDEESMAGGGAKPKRELTAQQRAIIANYRKKRAGFS